MPSFRGCQAAEADCDAKKLSGEGVAKQRKAIVDGLRDSILDFRYLRCLTHEQKRAQQKRALAKGESAPCAVPCVVPGKGPLARARASSSPRQPPPCLVDGCVVGGAVLTLSPPRDNSGGDEGVGGTTPKDVIDLLLLTQYFDMLKDIGSHPGTSTVFLPSDSAPVRDGIMQANAMAR